MLKELHDQLLERKPEGASHDEGTCPLCNVEIAASQETETEGGSVKSYTEEEVQALLASATKDLEAKVSELQGAQHASAIEAQISEAKAEAETKVAELQAELDTTTLKATRADEEKQEILAWLEAEAKTAEEKAALEARRDERVAKVREVASFSDEYVEKRATDWAAMSDEAFEAALEDWKAVAGEKKGETSETKVATETAMTASRDDNKTASSVLAEVLNLRFQGIDPRTV
jgi:DNA repair exonuclease SbcCD ATPase subunit